MRFPKFAIRTSCLFIHWRHSIPPALSLKQFPLFFLFYSFLHILSDHVLSLDGAFTSPQANETADFPSLLLHRQVPFPSDRAWVVRTPDARCALMIEVCELIELVRREKPEIEQRAWETGMGFSRGKTDERCERHCHLFDLGGESRILSCCEHVDFGRRSCRAVVWNAWKIRICMRWRVLCMIVYISAKRD